MPVVRSLRPGAPGVGQSRFRSLGLRQAAAAKHFLTVPLFFFRSRSHAGRLYSRKLPTGSSRFGYRVFMIEALFCLAR